MNLEIINFYLTDEDSDGSFFSGTLHVYLPDIDLDIRGVIVIMKDENWSFFMPNKISSVDGGQKIRYPTVTFRDKQKSKDLLITIIEKGKDFVARKMSQRGQ